MKGNGIERFGLEQPERFVCVQSLTRFLPFQKRAVETFMRGSSKVSLGFSTLAL